MDNPYAPPLAESAVTRGHFRGNRRVVRICQRGLLVCVVLYLGIVLAQLVVPISWRGALVLVALLDVVVAVAFVWALALQLYGPGVGLVLTALTLVPFIGLGILVFLTRRASAILRDPTATGDVAAPHDRLESDA